MGIIEITPVSPKYRLLGKLIGANMSTTVDQPIFINTNNYSIAKVTVNNASASLPLAVGGIYTAPSKGGSAMVPAVQIYSSLTSSTKVLSASVGISDMQTTSTLYFSLTTPQTGSVTADIYIWGEDYS